MTIAIVDTGVDYEHPDLAGKTLAGYNFVNGDANPQDDDGHGAHIAGSGCAGGSQPRETPRSGRGSNELAHPLYGADSDSPGNRSVLGLYTFAQEGQSPEHKVGMKEISNNQSYSVSKG